MSRFFFSKIPEDAIQWNLIEIKKNIEKTPQSDDFGTRFSLFFKSKEAIASRFFFSVFQKMFVQWPA